MELLCRSGEIDYHSLAAPKANSVHAKSPGTHASHCKLNAPAHNSIQHYKFPFPDISPPAHKLPSSQEVNLEIRALTSGDVKTGNGSTRKLNTGDDAGFTECRRNPSASTPVHRESRLFIADAIRRRKLHAPSELLPPCFPAPPV